MDDLLIERWRKGDPNATTAVRNAIRSVAERVLSHRALHTGLGPNARARLRNNEQRREVTAAIAAEIMRKPAESANQVKAAALMAASRVGVEGMQEGRPAAEDAHLPPPLAVAFALAPGSVHPRMREAAERHLGACGACREDVRVVDSIVRSWDAADTDATRDDLADAVEDGDMALPAGMNLADIMRDALDEQDRVDRGGPAPTPAKGPSRGATGSTQGRRGPSAPPASGGGSAKWIGLLVVIGVVGAAGFALSRGGAGRSAGGSGASGGAQPSRAGIFRTIADRSPPDLGELSNLPPEIKQIRQDIDNKDCRTAAGRARQLAAAHTDQPRLSVIEAGAFVCAGDGGKALKALDRLGDRSELAGDIAWVRAQAALLNEQPDAALDALKVVMVSDPGRSARAAAQVAQIEAAGG